MSMCYYNLGDITTSFLHRGCRQKIHVFFFPFQNGIESLAETLRQTAENAVQESGYVMDMESGMYYDYKSGYYYDPVSNAA